MSIGKYRKEDLAEQHRLYNRTLYHFPQTTAGQWILIPSSGLTLTVMYAVSMATASIGRHQHHCVGGRVSVLVGYRRRIIRVGIRNDCSIAEVPIVAHYRRACRAIRPVDEHDVGILADIDTCQGTVRPSPKFCMGLLNYLNAKSLSTNTTVGSAVLYSNASKTRCTPCNGTGIDCGYCMKQLPLQTNCNRSR